MNSAKFVKNKVEIVGKIELHEKVNEVPYIFISKIGHFLSWRISTQDSTIISRGILNLIDLFFKNLDIQLQRFYSVQISRLPCTRNMYSKVVSDPPAKKSRIDFEM